MSCCYWSDEHFSLKYHPKHAFGWKISPKLSVRCGYYWLNYTMFLSNIFILNWLTLTLCTSCFLLLFSLCSNCAGRHYISCNLMLYPEAILSHMGIFFYFHYIFSAFEILVGMRNVGIWFIRFQKFWFINPIPSFCIIYMLMVEIWVHIAIKKNLQTPGIFLALSQEFLVTPSYFWWQYNTCSFQFLDTLFELLVLLFQNEAAVPGLRDLDVLQLQGFVHRALGLRDRHRLVGLQFLDKLTRLVHLSHHLLILLTTSLKYTQKAAI